MIKKLTAAALAIITLLGVLAVPASARKGDDFRDYIERIEALGWAVHRDNTLRGFCAVTDIRARTVRYRVRGGCDIASYLAHELGHVMLIEKVSDKDLDYFYGLRRLGDPQWSGFFPITAGDDDYYNSVHETYADATAMIEGEEHTNGRTSRHIKVNNHMRDEAGAELLNYFVPRTACHIKLGYEIFLNRQPDIRGYNYWAGYIAWSLKNTADPVLFNIAISPEAARKTGRLNRWQFANRMILAATGRAPTRSEMIRWVDFMKRNGRHKAVWAIVRTPHSRCFFRHNAAREVSLL